MCFPRWPPWPLTSNDESLKVKEVCLLGGLRTANDLLCIFSSRPKQEPVRRFACRFHETEGNFHADTIPTVNSMGKHFVFLLEILVLAPDEKQWVWLLRVAAVVHSFICRLFFFWMSRPRRWILPFFLGQEAPIFKNNCVFTPPVTQF